MKNLLAGVVLLLVGGLVGAILIIPWIDFTLWKINKLISFAWVGRYWDWCVEKQSKMGFRRFVFLFVLLAACGTTWASDSNVIFSTGPMVLGGAERWSFFLSDSNGKYSKEIGTSDPKTGEVKLYKNYQPTQRDIMILIKANQNAWKYFEKEKQEELNISQGKQK